METQRYPGGVRRRLLAGVHEAVKRYELLAPGDRVLAAVSGGADSVAMLSLLVEIAPAFQLRLGVAHFNHGLRAEADADAEFVRDLAARLDLPFYAERADVAAQRRRIGGGLEEAARTLRYRFLETTAEREGYTRIALGHHADDNAETLLLNLLRGSGRRGLTGIAPVRPPRGIRPLILVRRAQIEIYLQSRRLSWRHDASNADLRFDRNRLRHRLLPELDRDFQPQVRRLLCRTADILRAEEDWLEALTAPLYAAARIADSPASEVDLEIETLRGFPVAARRRVIRRALQEQCGGLRRFGFAHIEQILKLLHRRPEAGPLALPGGVRAGRRGDRLCFWRVPAEAGKAPATAAGGGYDYVMARPGTLEIPEVGLVLTAAEIFGCSPSEFMHAAADTAYLDLAEIGFPLHVRNFRPGDRFRPLGAAGSRKLKKFFCDRKLPRAERRRCPLLISAGRIVWVCGQQIDHRARITPDTRRVLKVELRVARR